MKQYMVDHSHQELECDTSSPELVYCSASPNLQPVIIKEL